MKLFHISDLHLGKCLRGVSFIEDQKYILNSILELADSRQPDCLIIAGDVYDRSIPSAEASELLDNFLTELSSRKLPVVVTSGNHDSAERLSFGRSFMSGGGVYLSPVFDGTMEKLVLKDEYGKVNIYMLPFIKPVHVRRFFPEAEIESYTEAVKYVIENAGVDFESRNVIVAHQFVVSGGECPERSDSEIQQIGGIDSVDISAFDGFDYTALGHIHRPQKIGRENVRYSGTPLKYSFSEAGHSKSIAEIELGEKGNVSVTLLPLEPLRDMRIIRGSLEEVTTSGKVETDGKDDYVKCILTDTEPLASPMERIRTVYPNALQLEFENQGYRRGKIRNENVEEKPPMELFADFFELISGKSLSDAQANVMEKLLEGITGESL